MTTEKDELLERVAYLEKRTTDQAEELICLKSALADCLRRVQLLESSQGTHSPARRVVPRTSSESRASRNGTPGGTTGIRQISGRHAPRMPSNTTIGGSGSQRPPSQASARSLSQASSSFASTATPGFKVSSAAGSVTRPPTSTSKGGPQEFFRKRSSTTTPIISILTRFLDTKEDLSDPSSWIVIYGLPASRGLLQQRTLIHHCSTHTKYSTYLHRDRHDSLAFKPAPAPTAKQSLQVDLAVCDYRKI
ncbi:hypothetical protein Aperf_G00000089482 [Anoplocephala perfoliata]